MASEGPRRRFRGFLLAPVEMSSATRSRCYDDPEWAKTYA